MFNWNQILAQQERYKDLQREAERARLIPQVLAGRERRHRGYLRMATWLGRHLVIWGWRLQERYGTAAMVDNSWGHKPRPVSRCATANCAE
jgi:hypothetical protein